MRIKTYDQQLGKIIYPREVYEVHVKYIQNLLAVAHLEDYISEIQPRISSYITKNYDGVLYLEFKLEFKLNASIKTVEEYLKANGWIKHRIGWSLKEYENIDL